MQIPAYQYSWRSNRVGFNEIAKWLILSWRLFAQKPAKWILLMLLVVPFIWVIRLLPENNLFLYFMVSVFGLLLVFIYYAGLNYCAHLLYYSGDFRLGDVFAGPKAQLTNLTIIGMIAAVWFLIMLLLSFFIGELLSVWSLFADIQATGDYYSFFNSSRFISFSIWAVASIFLCIPVLMATSFASQLIVLRAMDPVRAIQASFYGCVKNGPVLTVYAIILIIGFFIFSFIPYGLGLLFVFFPTAILGWYAVFKSIFSIE